MNLKKVYMFYDRHNGFEGGPYFGERNLDFSSLSVKFRKERYAEAESEKEDYCIIFEHEFISWMVGQGVLTSIETVNVTVEIDTEGENSYIPSHWPLCPECGTGRGEEVQGHVRHALNRSNWFLICAKCGYEWGHEDRPYYPDHPMIEDDGRCIPSGCVPYAISQAGALSISDVLPICVKHGWSESIGMYDNHGIEAAGELGLRMMPRQIDDINGKRTLRKILATLHPANNYIVATKNHWLAVVNGENRDPAATSLRAEVSAYWEVLPATETVPGF